MKKILLLLFTALFFNEQIICSAGSGSRSGSGSDIAGCGLIKSCGDPVVGVVEKQVKDVLPRDFDFTLFLCCKS
jgi:hypothetical protein